MQVPSRASWPHEGAGRRPPRSGNVAANARVPGPRSHLRSARVRRARRHALLAAGRLGVPASRRRRADAESEARRAVVGGDREAGSEGVLEGPLGAAREHRVAARARSRPSGRPTPMRRSARPMSRAASEHTQSTSSRSRRRCESFLRFSPEMGTSSPARWPRWSPPTRRPVGSGTVARTKRISVAERAEAAVIAWMRHQTTAYDQMSIPRVAGKRREVRRELARISRDVLDLHRRDVPHTDRSLPAAAQRS